MSIFEGTMMGGSSNLIGVAAPGASALLSNGMLPESNPDLIEPFVNGYNYIAFTKLATFFGPEVAGAFRAYTERNFKGLDLFQDYELETQSITHGFNGQSYDVPANLKRDINRLTTTHNEFWNLPVSRLVAAWVEGIRDPETGMAHYHGNIHNADTHYKPSYHTGAGFTWVTDPAGKGLLKAAMLVNLFPLPVKMNHFNFSSGDHSTQEMSINFSCIYHESKYIDAIASKLNELSPANKQHANAWGSDIFKSLTEGTEGATHAHLFDADWKKTSGNSVLFNSKGQFDFAAVDTDSTDGNPSINDINPTASELNDTVVKAE